MVAALPPSSPSDLEERRIGNVEIRPSELQVLIDGRRVGLTVREFELFHVLAERLDRVVQRAEIYQLVWGGKMPRRDRSVDVLHPQGAAQARAGRSRVDLHPHPLRRSATASRPSAGLTSSSPELPWALLNAQRNISGWPTGLRAGEAALVAVVVDGHVLERLRRRVRGQRDRVGLAGAAGRRASPR